MGRCLGVRAVLSDDAVRAGEAMLDKLRHIHRTQQYFLKAWRAEELSYEETGTTLDDELALARAWHREARSWLDTLDDESLTRALPLPWADRFARRAGAAHAQPTLLGETMYQLVAHTTYHRAQANTLLRQAGVAPPLVDYIAWLWLGRPEPDWP